MEILVLGAGMVGVSSALALQLRGHQVTLVDRRPPGRETSYGNAGIIQREAVEPYAFPRDMRMLARIATGISNDAHIHWVDLPGLAPCLWKYWRASAPRRYAPIVRAYSALIAHCLDEHAPWIETAGAADLVQREGFLQVYRSPRAFEAAAAQATAVAREHGLECALLDGSALAAAQPALRKRMAGAVHWREPWTVRDPGELVARYGRLFESRGGLVVTGDATTLTARGAHWSVDVVDAAGRAGTVKAAQAVIALGPWSERLTRRLGYHLPLFVKRGYHRHYAGQGAPGMPVFDVERGYVLAPMTRGMRITTGAEFARLGAVATPVQLRRAERYANELVELGEPAEREPWLGARPCTADMLPVIGPAPRHAGLWFHFGHAHQGFTLGPATGRLVAEMISGERPFVDPAPYRAERFF
jgi:D-amino-acid dehydrogenase